MTENPGEPQPQPQPQVQSQSQPQVQSQSQSQPQAPSPSQPQAQPPRRPRPSGVNGVIWVLEHTQDIVSVAVGVLLVVLAAVVLVLGIVDFFHDLANAPALSAVTNLLDRVLLVLILVEIMHTVVLSLRAHHLVTQPLLAVGLVAVIRKILFILSSEKPAPTAELALLVSMIVVFVAALILVSRYESPES